VTESVPSTDDFHALLRGRCVTHAAYAQAGSANEGATWHVSRDGHFTRTDDGLRALFQGTNGVHEVRAILRNPGGESTGVAARFLVHGWKQLSYVAVGRTTGNSFRHIKAQHVQQGEWTQIAFDDEDLILRIETAGEPHEPAPSNDVRIYIKGIPGDEGAVVEVDWVGSWTATGKELLGEWPVAAPDSPVRRALTEYLLHKNPAIDDDARRYLETGDFPILPGVFLPWGLAEPIPEEVSTSPTYRYAWHSLYPAAFLLLHADQHGSSRARWAALRIIDDWLTRSFYSWDPDPRYAWYDHGTAERAITLLLARATLKPSDVDRRTLARLDEAILEHAFLLENEAFYARNQRSRFHNHAWFQDLALLAAAALAPSAASSRWISTARRRLRAQVTELISTERQVSVFVENSIGYHHGVQTLVEFADSLVTAASGERDLHEIAIGLRRWSQLFRYEDGRAPSNGDTFRIPNPASAPARRLERPLGATILPRAGYAHVAGSDRGRQFTLCFFATSLNRTHKHADNLSVTLSLDGVEWMIDPSFYSHQYEDPIPAYLRGAAAHSAPFIPGVEYSIEPGLASLSGTTDASGGFVFEGLHRAFADHLVRRTLRGPVDHLHVEGSDSVEGPVQRTAVGRFHLGDGVTPHVSGNRIILTHTATPAALELTLPSKPVVLAGWHGDPDTSSISGTGFQEYVDTHTLVVPVDESGRLHWTLRAIH